MEYENCANTDGSFVCSCDSGYERIDGVCVDKNECVESACGNFENCVNLDKGVIICFQNSFQNFWCEKAPFL